MRGDDANKDDRDPFKPAQIPARPCPARKGDLESTQGSCLLFHDRRTDGQFYSLCIALLLIHTSAP
jgi:hypothetical protein